MNDKDEGLVRVVFVSSLADPEAPTAAELNAGREVYYTGYGSRRRRPWWRRFLAKILR